MKVNNKEELNQAIINVIQKILNTGASSKGDVFDQTVSFIIKNEIKNINYVSSEQWASTDKFSIYKQYREKTINFNFDFSDLPKICDNGKIVDLILVDKPNGSQKWPDMLIIYNNIGLPIEIKSSKNDVILWNSGLPKKDTLYIFNCYGKNKTTVFLGQHAITDEVYDLLIQQSILAKKLNKKYKNSEWSFYVRDMFNSKQKFFHDENIKKKIEHETIEFIKNIKWTSGSKKDIFKKNKMI